MAEEMNAAAEAALNALRAARKARLDAENEIERSVIDARHVNAGWRLIAEELGILQPNCTRKYKPMIEAGKWKPRPKWDALPAEDRAAPALVAVRHAKQALVDMEAAELQAVADARAAEVTWDDIAEVFSMHQPNVIAKFKPLLVEERIVRVWVKGKEPGAGGKKAEKAGTAAKGKATRDGADELLGRWLREE
ncbi:hypothetical protein F5972_08580 [Microbispora cellulosiformans]|uniref:Uncharacterized protein n=1 Tax=Microbispora cellulosiformans TaxID=2614688 RepID=A0A5J5K591_9ACTN|nr:hypothetical protein [Microbispora cellulosiformans]KAA9379696.1 hypothetical protein F5972_08580 [Microbispora cellulosiformans]